jgi:hypothetical protein
MILRRVIQHFKKQEWLAIALDFLIVVVGVLLANQISAWNAMRAEQKRADALYVQIAEDLKSERVSLNGTGEYFATTIGYAKTALIGFEAPETLPDNAFVIAAYQASQWYDPATSRSTYNELIATGAINMIRNESARGKLVGYFEFDWTQSASMKTRPAYREFLRGVMPFPVQQAIVAACGDKDVVTNRTTVASLPRQCPLELPTADAAAAADALRSAPGLEAALRYQLAENTSKIGSLASYIKQLDALVAVMKDDRN